MEKPTSSLEEHCITSIRLLAVDMIERARSGHPGLPLGAAPMAFALWTRHLRHNPRDPHWFNRDRFILSAGHGSALLYALLHLTGYDLTVQDLQNFRQWGSRTPGHPEFGVTPGVECTTGPLGQGFAMGVGMAMAEKWLADRFNRPGFSIIDHYVYGLVSDGDLMEGIASEAASLAGHLKLGKIVYLYDDNHITIEGPTELAFTEDVQRRFKAYGWHVQAIDDGNDVDAVSTAIQTAKEVHDKPSLILVHTQIGYGSPKQNNASCHGEPLGPDAARATKEAFGWPPDSSFHVPAEVREFLGRAIENGTRSQKEWENLLEQYSKHYPHEAAAFRGYLSRELPLDWEKDLPVFKPEQGPMATRQASGLVLNAIAKNVGNLVGGSADLAPSNKTLIQDGGDRNIHFGIREHAMAAILNGMALHGGLRPYGGTFLVFADYMRPALRLAALMKTNITLIFTHDSIGVGEDGPTHQPVEHIASLRIIPDFTVIRPADANETVAAWQVAMEMNGPVALILTRQKIPTLDVAPHQIREGVRKGAYVVRELGNSADVILIATGSEVSLALEAQDRLHKDHGIGSRVVSMPSWELFSQQDQATRNQVLPPSITARVAVEAGVSYGWERWIDKGRIVSVDRFGASAPGSQVMEKLGLTADRVVAAVLETMGITT